MTATQGQPIVCTLGPTAMAPRLARIRSMTQPQLRAHRLEGSRLLLTYDPAALAELRRIVGL